MNLWAVSAVIEVKKNTGSIFTQVPSFILNGNTHGFMDAKGAKKVIESIVNPLNNPNIIVTYGAEKI